jgi:CubicO group peptidase (beta-lactamase class C family)
MALVPGATPESVGLDSGRLHRITQHFDHYVNDRRLAGYLATVSRGGQLVWSGRGGHQDRENDVAMSDDTIFRIYSMTKPITSVLAMMFYEDGVFDLNDDAGQWIDELREPRVWVGGTPSAPQTRAAAEPVRVHHLLSHMSGLTYGFQYNHNVDAIYRAKGYDFGMPKEADLTQAVHDWCTSPLLFEPGSAWNYSVSVDVIGRLIEIWSGKTLDVVMRERLLDPLDMHDTDWYVPEEKAARLAQLYVPFNGDSFAYDDIGRHALRWPKVLGGGGGLVSTARDYERFMAMLLNGGEYNGVRILSSRTLDLMTMNHLPGNVDLDTLAQDSFAEVNMKGIGFGLGFSTCIDQAATKSHLSPGSFAWGGAASTAFWVDPMEELTVGFYTQLLPSSTYPVRRDLQRLVYSAMTE